LIFRNKNYLFGSNSLIQTHWAAKEGDTWQGIWLKSKKIERIGM